MKKKRVVPIWVSVILLLICLAGTIACAYWTIGLFNTSPLAAVLQFVMLLSNVFAIDYCIGGYNKDSAIFFKLVCIFLALSSVAALVGVFAYHVTLVLTVVISVLLLIIRLAFVFINNLGKKMSYLLAFSVLGLMIILLINTMLTNPAAWLSTFTLSRISVDIVFLIMVYAKYQDKAARGTK